MIAISMGWGVQSWTLAAMSALGDLPKVDVVIHGDTQHERSSTYAFAKEWTPWLEAHGIKVVAVTNQDSEGTLVVFGRSERGGKIQIPAFTFQEDKKGQIRRQCTDSWKIAPLRRWLQTHRNSQPVELWLGISMDEFHRAKDSGRKYIKHRFPLLERRYDRQQCLDWLKLQGLPQPGKSSCVFCPFLNKAAWIDMRANHPEDWDEAVRVDESIRLTRMPGELFIHSSRKPLSQVIPLLLPNEGQSILELLDTTEADAGETCDTGHCFL